MLTLLRLPLLAPPSRAFACSAFIVAALQLVVCAQRFPSLPSKPEQICRVAVAGRQSERSELFLAVELEAARKLVAPVADRRDVQIYPLGRAGEPL